MKEYLTVTVETSSLANHLTELAKEGWTFEAFVPLRDQGFMVKVLLSRESGGCVG